MGEKSGLFEHPARRTARAKFGLVEENATGGAYPAATMKRGFARLAAGTYEVWLGGPGRGRTYGPLIKSANRAVFITA